MPVTYLWLHSYSIRSHILWSITWKVLINSLHFYLQLMSANWWKWNVFDISWYAMSNPIQFCYQTTTTKNCVNLSSLYWSPQNSKIKLTKKVWTEPKSILFIHSSIIPTLSFKYIISSYFSYPLAIFLCVFKIEQTSSICSIIMHKDVLSKQQNFHQPSCHISWSLVAPVFRKRGRSLKNTPTGQSLMTKSPLTPVC